MENSNPSSDAFFVLMGNAKKKERCLPNPSNKTNKLKKLKNKFREFLSTNNG